MRCRKPVSALLFRVSAPDSKQLEIECSSSPDASRTPVFSQEPFPVGRIAKCFGAARARDR